MSGGYNYADAYSRYRQGVSSDSDFEKYVDAKHGSYWKLIDAYNKGEDVDKKFAGQYQHPAGLSPSQQAEYWQKRGANSKAAFGRAHAAEDEALRSGTYKGGTKVKPWEGDTTFETWNKNKDKEVVDDTTPTGPIQHDNPYFPMLTQDYSSPASQDWSSYLGGNKGLLFQPWTSDYQAAAGIPNNLWNYAPPEGIDYAVRYTNPLTGKLDMDLMPAGDSTSGGNKNGNGNTNDERGDPRTQAEIDEQEAAGYFTDKWGNKVSRGFSSFENLLAGITIADETAASRWAESGSQGVIDSTGAATPASSGQGVTFDPSVNPYAL